MTAAAPQTGELRFSQRQAGPVALHVVEAGPADGPPVILLHGFPEFWYGWRHQIGALAGAGYRVIVPDQRGYNLSDKPAGVAAYDLDVLATDVIALADALGLGEFALVGHDWGASVGWWVAQHHTARLRCLVAMNAPHPAVWRDAMQHDPQQRKLSWYVRVFALPVFPELTMRLGRFKALRDALSDAARPPSEAELARYRKAWSQAGALTAMVNWYRAFLKHRFSPLADTRIGVPTHILWGARDRYAQVSLAEASRALCSRAALTVFPDATHWVQHDETDRVNAAVSEFLRP
jgi:pimeloyl-ACP methyl ester carboxylesterase